MRLLRNQIVMRGLVAVTVIGHLLLCGWSLVPASDSAAGPYAQWLRSQLEDAPDESFEEAIVAAASGRVASLAGFVDAFVDAYAAVGRNDVGEAFGEAIDDAEGLRSFLKSRFGGLSGVALVPRLATVGAIWASTTLAATAVVGTGVTALEVHVRVVRKAASAVGVIRFLFGAAQPLGP